MKTTFFQNPTQTYLLQHKITLSDTQLDKIAWLLHAQPLNQESLSGEFIGPRREMVTPWSTNAVEIAQNAGVEGIIRIECFKPASNSTEFDPMLQQRYQGLNDSTLLNEREPEPIQTISNIREYNTKVGLALSPDEIEYLEDYAKEKGRGFTDSELFGFAQVNSEHCRHKIFNGKFVIDGETKEKSLFKWIKETTKQFPGNIVTNYDDNVAFTEGCTAEEFKPQNGSAPSYFHKKSIETVFSLKAETHNFPTTVEPFNGAATGAGGEIRDRMAGGKGSYPLAGTACYMTGYPRLGNQSWEKKVNQREWLYQTPQEILTKASNGASDFGNKFGQPLINGSLLTFENETRGQLHGFDKTIMLAGGIGYANKRDALKDKPVKGDKIVLLGGDNYRIGMGGSAVSSLDTGKAEKDLELNAVQRSNPEMQKRAYNVIRTLCEATENPVVLIHDHGAGGHINCLSELIEGPGGIIDISKLPVGDPSLSDKEIVGNESQERMGLVVKEKDLPLLKAIAQRERAPLYVIGEVTGDEKFIMQSSTGKNAVDIELEFLFGKPPRSTLTDSTKTFEGEKVLCKASSFSDSLNKVLQLEGVACKDWLTNKVDRSVSGKVGQQQCVGPLQLPLHGAGVMAIDFRGKEGIATAMGHNPAAALLDSATGSVLAIAESLTNLIFVPMNGGLRDVTLSANWMWPCKSSGEDARLYAAVEEAAEFAMDLNINISTGKDSLSMTQKYPSGQVVKAPGTVIVSAMGQCIDIKKIVTPDLKPIKNSHLLYINFSGSKENHLGGSCLAQTQGVLGEVSPTVESAEKFANAFNTIQSLINQKLILAGQDVSSGGVIVALLEMAFAGDLGVLIDSPTIPLLKTADDLATWLFCEKPGLVIQIADEHVNEVLQKFKTIEIEAFKLGTVSLDSQEITLTSNDFKFNQSIDSLRQTWFKPSYLLEKFQVPEALADDRWENFSKNKLEYQFPKTFTGLPPLTPTDQKTKAAILREKGTNGEREMAYALYAAGFDVKDVTMTDITEGRENLEDISFLVFCGGFSNSDVLGSARGWAGVFKYNPLAASVLKNFYARPETLSLGVCNGCQLMRLLGLIDENDTTEMEHNDSGKFESAFLNVSIPSDNKAILFKGLEESQLGIWVAHGEGKFSFPQGIEKAHVALTYSGKGYPANPNGSESNVAGISSSDGRHLAMMPHLERAIFPWQWAYTTEVQQNHATTPWLQAFVNGRKWIESQN